MAAQSVELGVLAAYVDRKPSSGAYAFSGRGAGGAGPFVAPVLRRHGHGGL